MNVAVMVMAEVPLGVPGAPEFFVDVPLPQPLMQSAGGRTRIRKSSRKWRRSEVSGASNRSRECSPREEYIQRKLAFSHRHGRGRGSVVIVIVCDATLSSP